MQQAWKTPLKKFTQWSLRNTRATCTTHFEIVALASHDEKIRKIVFEDYQKDIEAVEAFVEEKKKQGFMRTDVDARVLAELFTALYMGTMAKLVIGFPNKEVHDHWIKSMMLILRKHKN